MTNEDSVVPVTAFEDGDNTSRSIRKNNTLPTLPSMRMTLPCITGSLH